MFKFSLFSFLIIEILDSHRKKLKIYQALNLNSNATHLNAAPVAAVLNRQ